MSQDNSMPKDDEKGPGEAPLVDQAGNHDVDPIIGQAVGTQLKSLFDEFASESVPDRFLDLIGQLEESEKKTNIAARDGNSEEGAK